MRMSLVLAMLYSQTIDNPYPGPVYTGMPLVDPVHTGIPLSDPASACRVTWNTTDNNLIETTAMHSRNSNYCSLHWNTNDSRFKSIYSTMYRHQSYKTMEQCEKTNQNNSWWVHVWRPSLRPYGRYHKGHQKMFGSTGRIKVSRYDSNNNNKKKGKGL